MRNDKSLKLSCKQEVTKSSRRTREISNTKIPTDNKGENEWNS